MPEYELADEFELRGEFWRPERLDERLSGTLRYSAGDVDLDLVGRFTDENGAEVERTTLIVGTTDGGSCTLGDPYVVRSRAVGDTAAGVTTSGWSSPRLLLGHLIENKDAESYTAGDFYFQELDHWLGHSPFEQTHEQAGEGRPVKVAKYTYPDNVVIDLPSHGATLTIFYALSSGGPDWYSISWKQRAGVRIDSASPQSYEWFMERLGDIRSLLGLLVGEPVRPYRITLHPTLPAGLDRAERQRAEAMSSTDVYAPIVGMSRGAQIHPMWMILTYESIADAFPEIARRWFEKRDELVAAVAVFFGTLYAERLLGEFRFLALTQALETLHRRTRPGVYVPEEEYDEIAAVLVSAIPESVSRDFRQALKARIRFGNEFALRKRLRELRNGLDPESRMVVLPDATFLERVVNERNYLTHYPSGESASMTHAELFYASMRLRAFLTALLLAEVGLTGRDVAEGIRRTRWFRGYVLGR